MARRGGFTNLHLHGWWSSLGHYEPREAYFPGGLDEMQATAERIRAAGLKPGIHTLTACISPNDPWGTLVPGANRVTLAYQAQPAVDFRVIVKTVKIYR